MCRLTLLVSQPPKPRWVLPTQLLPSVQDGMTSTAAVQAPFTMSLRWGTRYGSLEHHRGRFCYRRLNFLLQDFSEFLCKKQ